jgi:hypothetical protein
MGGSSAEIKAEVRAKVGDSRAKRLAQREHGGALTMSVIEELVWQVRNEMSEGLVEAERGQQLPGPRCSRCPPKGKSDGLCGREAERCHSNERIGLAVSRAFLPPLGAMGAE